MSLIIMNTKHEELLTELITLFHKYNLCIVPTYEDLPSAHDPMYIVEFNSFWEEYFKNHVYLEKI